MKYHLTVRLFRHIWGYLRSALQSLNRSDLVEMTYDVLDNQDNSGVVLNALQNELAM